MKRIKDTKAGQQIAVYMVSGLDRAPWHIIVHNTEMTTRAEVRAAGGNRQYGISRGLGYDWLTAALAGLGVMGVALYDHCGPPNRPKGLEGLRRAGCFVTQIL